MINKKIAGISAIFSLFYLSTHLNPDFSSFFTVDEKFKTTALASAWLGNDETHYVRKHSKYDINDLKELLSATISYLDLNFQYLKAKELVGQ